MIGTTIALAAVVAGAAIGATKALTPRQERQAVIDDAAGRLGVKPSELSKALEQALENRVDAAVADGRLSKEQGARLKQRIDAGDLPMLGLGPRGFRHGPDGFRGRGGFPGMMPGGKLDGAADYLGLGRMQLFQALSAGKTLASLARDRGKSVSGLVDAMVAAARKRLDEAVAAGRLTEADRKEVLAGLKERIARLVNEGLPRERTEHGRTDVPSTSQDA